MDSKTEQKVADALRRAGREKLQALLENWGVAVYDDEPMDDLIESAIEMTPHDISVEDLLNLEHDDFY